MRKITPNFTYEEFGNPPATAWLATYNLAVALEVIRKAAGSPIRVTSAYRADSNTRHGQGAAVDFKAVRGPYQDPPRMAELVESLIRVGAIPEGGVGTYDRHTHYDHRGGNRARWQGVSKDNG